MAGGNWVSIYELKISLDGTNQILGITIIFYFLISVFRRFPCGNVSFLEIFNWWNDKSSLWGYFNHVSVFVKKNDMFTSKTFAKLVIFLTPFCFSVSGDEGPPRQSSDTDARGEETKTGKDGLCAWYTEAKKVVQKSHFIQILMYHDRSGWEWNERSAVIGSKLFHKWEKL